MNAAICRSGALATLAMLALSACGGGGHVAPNGASNVPAKINAKMTTIKLALTIPNSALAAKHRLPAYVSTSTRSASVVVQPANVTSDADLAVASPNCVAVNGGRTCTIPIAATVGANTFALTLYDGACTGGPPCAHSGSALSAASAFASTVVEGQANVTLPLVLGGVVQTATITVDADSPGAAHSVRVVVTALDAAGNTIVGPAPFVNLSGTATPIGLRAQLEPALNSLEPAFTLNGVVQGTHNVVNVSAPTDAVALSVDSTTQQSLGAAIRTTSGVAGSTAYAFYKAYGTGVPGLTSVNYGFSLNGGAISTLAPAPFGEIAARGTFAGSNGGWITNMTTTANWTNASVNMYCHLTPAATNIEGIGVDTSGNAYVSYFDGSQSKYAYVPFGYANAVNPCQGFAPGFIGPLPFGASGNYGGAVAVTPNTIFLVNQIIAATPFNDEIEIATPALGSTAFLYVNPVAGVGNGLSGAAIDPTDGSLWVNAYFTGLIYHITGTPGVPASFAVAGSYALPSCQPNGLTTDGTFLYAACTVSGKTYVITPHGLAAPTIASITTGPALSGVSAFENIAIGPDGYLWIMTSSSTIEKFNRLLGGSSLVTVSTGGYLNNVVAGGDGDLWLSNSLAGGNTYRLGAGAGP